MQTLASTTLAAEMHVTESCTLFLDAEHLRSISVAPRVHLDIILIVSADEPSAHTLDITLQEHAIVKVWSAIFSAETLTLNAHLEGNNAVFEHYGLYVGMQKHTITERLRCVHSSERTMSRSIISGIALASSTIDIKGMIDISLSGHGTDTHFGHEGLLLSRRARINAEPGLEIHTNDVKATHSSAVHFIRPEQLFYLETRALNEAEGKRMIAEGFLTSALPQLPDTAAAERITTYIDQAIATL